VASFLDEQVVNLSPIVDRTFLLKKCRAKCEDQCGVCRICLKACKPDCTSGVESGVGHVWRLNDTLPGFLVAESIEIFRSQAKLLTTADGFLFFRRCITKLIRRSYAELFDNSDKDAWNEWEERLHEALSVSDYPAILLHYLAPLAPNLTESPTTPASTEPITMKRRTRK